MRNTFLGLIAAIVGILFSLIFLLAQMGRWILYRFCLIVDGKDYRVFANIGTMSKEGGRQHADQQAKDAQSVIATISNDLIRDLLTDLN